MKKNSKEAIVEAAVHLFNTKGYNGTSIRDIAAKAKVNSANINYYFKSKHGLLEYCFTSFFENYISELEKGYFLLDEGAAVSLKKVAENILLFYCANLSVSRFVLREMSIDSQVVREILSTYFVKERFMFKEIIETGMKKKEFRSQSPSYTIIQLKGLLAMPFLNSQYVTEVLHIYPNEPYFSKKYLKEIYRWIDSVVCVNLQDQDSVEYSPT